MARAIRKISSGCGFTSAFAARVAGTPERPRLAVFRSVKHIYAQVIDDTEGHTVAAASSSEKNGEATAAMWRARKRSASWWPSAPRTKASRPWCSTAAGIMYHGRVKALADAAREAGLEF